MKPLPRLRIGPAAPASPALLQASGRPKTIKPAFPGSSSPDAPPLG